MPKADVPSPLAEPLDVERAGALGGEAPSSPGLGRVAPSRKSVAESSASPKATESEQSSASLRGPSTLDEWIDNAPAWLASAVLHLLLLVCCALLAFGADDDASLSLSAVFGEDVGEQMIEESVNLSAELELASDEQPLTPDLLPPVLEPLSTPIVADVTPIGSSSADALSPNLGATLSGRSAGMRESLLKAYGGTEETEAAVLEGLRWLARQQRSDGGWSLKGPYPDGSRHENREAATAMALLAFQGAGHLPGDDGPFGREVLRGWKWLLEQQDTNTGAFFSAGGRNHRFYTEGQCAIALCELYGMTSDDRYRRPAQTAVDYLVASQGEEGGWKYEPGEDSDLSVTGWVLMALKSARIAGLEVPSDVFLRVEEFLDSVGRVNGSRYVYEPQIVFNPERIPTLTAEGLLCRQYLGWPKDHLGLRQGVDFLLENLPEWRKGRRDIYYWYYATQVCRHMGGPTWEAWNREMREVLPAHQEMRGRGKRGSWDPNGDRWGPLGGRLYQTCLSIYVLEVYYRHLPIYSQRAIRSAR